MERDSEKENNLYKRAMRFATLVTCGAILSFPVFLERYLAHQVTKEKSKIYLTETNLPDYGKVIIEDVDRNDSIDVVYGENKTPLMVTKDYEKFANKPVNVPYISKGLRKALTAEKEAKEKVKYQIEKSKVEWVIPINKYF